ncbi:hypothetical protein EPO44_19340 [bacterium]|nr:MAG: hypothetical protein EPO44_19340 [bacterium]
MFGRGKRWGIRCHRMIQAWVWGDVPTGFKKFSPNRRRMVLVREGLERSLAAEKFFTQREGEKGASPFHGRGRLRFFHLDNGETALVRTYRHGGLLRHVTGDCFFTWPPRPFRELAITAEVSRRGVPTLEILAAWVERLNGPFYRGWLMTRELKGADDLWVALQSEYYAENDRGPLLQAVARGIRRMHDQGIYHGDLNLKNIMVRREGGRVVSYIIDFDKAELFSREVPVGKAERNLRRLLRSVCKLDPDRRHLSPEAWDLFLGFYREANAG